VFPQLGTRDETDGPKAAHSEHVLDENLVPAQSHRFVEVFEMNVAVAVGIDIGMVVLVRPIR